MNDNKNIKMNKYLIIILTHTFGQCDLSIRVNVGCSYAKEQNVTIVDIYGENVLLRALKKFLLSFTFTNT